jgi:hypothetical protein
MSTIWLIVLILAAAAVWFYARRWISRPSGMPEMLTASYSYQTLEFMNYYAGRDGGDPEKYEINIHIIQRQMKNLKLVWRQRKDVLDYMKKMGWVYEILAQEAKLYVVSRVGARELETADGLRGAVKEAAQALHDEGISSDHAKAAAAAVIAAALRVDARSAPPESQGQAEASANEIEDAVNSHDIDKIDRGIARVNGILQMVTYSLPLVRDMLRIFGW